MEPLLGMPAGWLPRDSAQLDTYMRDMLAGGSIVVTDTSRALARAVLYPPQWYVAWPAFRAMQLLTIGSLPPSIRQAYGFDWRAARRAGVRALDGTAPHVAAAASAVRARVADGEARSTAGTSVPTASAPSRGIDKCKALANQPGRRRPGCRSPCPRS